MTIIPFDNRCMVIPGSYQIVAEMNEIQVLKPTGKKSGVKNIKRLCKTRDFVQSRMLGVSEFETGAY